MVPTRNPDLAVVLILYAGAVGGPWMAWLCRNGADREPGSPMSLAEQAVIATFGGVIAIGAAILFTAEYVGLVDRSSAAWEMGLIVLLALGATCFGLWGLYRLAPSHRGKDDPVGEQRPVHPWLGVVRILGAAVIGVLFSAGMIVGQFSSRRREDDPSLFSLALGYFFLACLLVGVPTTLAKELRRRQDASGHDRPPPRDPPPGW